MNDSSRPGELENALMILRLLTDLSGDGRIWLPEVIRLLQDAAGM